MVDRDHLRRLTNLRDQYINASDALIELSLALGQWVPEETDSWERWALLVQQRRDLGNNALNSEIDAMLRRS